MSSEVRCIVGTTVGAAARRQFLTPVKGISTIPRLGLKAVLTFAEYRGWRNRMAIKKPYAVELTVELEGDDAHRLVEYVKDPLPPEGHSEYLDQCDEIFKAVYSPQRANDLYY
jgi:hypothetical protein